MTIYSSIFYEKPGGSVIGEEEIERAGQKVIKITYGWSDLDQLIQLKA